jgi:hypothetical protein
MNQKKNGSEPYGPRNGLGERDRDERQIVAEDDQNRSFVSQEFIEVIEEVGHQDQENECEGAENDREDQFPHKIPVQDFQKGFPSGVAL